MPHAPINLVDAHHVPAVARPLLIVTEGILDIVCLTQLSRIVRTTHADLPDLERLVEQGRIIFLPAGGGDLAAWTRRLAPLNCPEFFLLDREQEPETDLRRRIVQEINQRPGCRAYVTRMRSLENYLHPAAVEAACGVTIEITDETPVAEQVVRSHPEWEAIWPTLTYRARQRLIGRTKRRLNTVAVAHMTAELLDERDPAGEVVGWFRAIQQLLPSQPRPL